MFRILTFKSDRAFWPLAGPSASDAASQSRGLVGRTIAKIVGELRAWRATQSLSSLDERMLRDIGINRDQIWYVTRHGRETRQPVDQWTDGTRW
jgi:uncharacterized protein YjiS (DUF1127 family)